MDAPSLDVEHGEAVAVADDGLEVDKLLADAARRGEEVVAAEHEFVFVGKLLVEIELIVLIRCALRSLGIHEHELLVVFDLVPLDVVVVRDVNAVGHGVVVGGVSGGIHFLLDFVGGLLASAESCEHRDGDGDKYSGAVCHGSSCYNNIRGVEGWCVSRKGPSFF